MQIKTGSSSPLSSPPQHHSLIILGSGPAGCTAAIYAARANLKPAMILGTERGGQLTRSAKVENWPGDAQGISGYDLMERMLQHAEHFGTKMISAHIASVDLKQRPFVLQGDGGIYSCDALIIATGASPKFLGLPNEQEFLGRGISTCAMCDGFLYRGSTVAVVGGGNTALEDAAYLASLAKQVILIHRRDAFRADNALQAKINELVKAGKIVLELQKQPIEILSDVKGVTGIKLKDVVSGEIKTLAIDACFVAIGTEPNTGLFADHLALDHGSIKISGSYQTGYTATTIAGVFAAGDVANPAYRQAITAAGMGCMAARDASVYLRNLSL
jgi:thioredoxin-disulfide reductase